ncbi:perivitellin-2 67 kDa subunit [Elysia marginata]|uniref:Perivitellin-2 67 kDa subunit n=1 Tax=Elysia marginata TaxID=1093978 RepID=A0AAV4FH90_9GAST|nr:perivitellin-2 67 kDa subunit [Elysia marginata]
MSEHRPRTNPNLVGSCLLLTIVCLTSVTSLGRAQFQPGSSGDVECSKAPPGVRKIVKGVDITTLDLVPLDFTTSDGFKSPVINFTCNLDRKYTRGVKTYQLPDQIWQMTNNPGGWVTSNAQLYKTSKDVRTSMAKDVGGQGSIWKFSFSASKSYTKMQHTITNSSKYISDVASFYSSTQVDLIPDWLLQMNWIAKLYVQRFMDGKTYQSDPDVYQEFINQFGTHYFSVANFGGHIRSVYETSTSYFSSHTDSQAKKNAKASFLKLLSAHGGSVKGSTTVDSQFSSKSTETVRYYGGSTNLLSSVGIQTWQPTVDDNPWLFSGELKPISDLLSNDTQRSSMEEAVKQHVMRAFLGELWRLLTTATSKMGSSAATNELARRLADMEALPLGSLVEADVEKLEDDIKKQTTVPSWFTANTQLCYQWRPDGDGGQCGGGAARRLCARPGSMTPVYRDDTDGRGGGCRMQWSIQSTGFESWFSQVQICYRWHPDGDGGQCGGGAARLLCAGLNKFSPEYRDDTDGRGGGCQMSWRIIVPDAAPLWMKAIKLCYSWYPDGDGGQCGPPGKARSLCATANQWTTYYRDDTDGRGGGCRMSWGLQLGA